MSDVKCPYCKAEQEINHDDGYGYEDGIEYSQNCTDCGKEFKFYASFSINYEVLCSGEHNLEQSPVKGCEELWNCSNCDHYELKV